MIMAQAFFLYRSQQPVPACSRTANGAGVSILIQALTQWRLM